jgi:integrase
MTKLKYVKSIADRHGGDPFYYFRHHGKMTRLRGIVGSPEFTTHYEELLTATKPSAVNNIVALGVCTKSHETAQKLSRPVRVGFLPGSMAWVIDRYLTDKSSPYHKLAAGSRDNYRRFLDVLRDKFGALPITDLTRGNVTQLCKRIANEHGQARGILTLRLFSILWQYAITLPEAKIADNAHNPTRDVKLNYQTEKPAAAWPQEVRERFLKDARSELRLAFYLLLYTGQRRGDVIKMRWSDYDAHTGYLNIVQQKTGQRVPVRVHRELAKVLADAPRAGGFILMSSHGGPYTGSSLSHAFAYRLRDVGCDPGAYTLHGLRKTAGVLLAEAGATELEIMRVLGHTKADQAHAYCVEAGKAKLTDAAMKKWEAA